MRASARSPAPRARITWWIRPGPSRAWAAANPPPSSPRMFVTGTRTSSKTISQWPGWCWWPKTGNERTISMPGVSAGTITIDCWRCVSASGSVLPMTTKTLQRGSAAPEIHHLRPLMTYSSPSRTMRVSMFVASQEATAGSVIAKAERISPSAAARATAAAAPRCRAGGAAPCCRCRERRSWWPRGRARGSIRSARRAWRTPAGSAPTRPAGRGSTAPARWAVALSSSTTGGTEWSSWSRAAR